MDRRDLGADRAAAVSPDGLSDTGPETLRRISRMGAFNAWMMDLVRPHLRGRVLEVGCGQGNITELLLREDVRELVALDVSAEHAEAVRRRWRDVPRFSSLCGDLLDPAIARELEGTADTLVCLNVLEHIEDDERALAVMAAALAPGGRVVLLVPALRWLYGSLDENLRHFRRYSKSGLKAKIQGAGLRVVAWRYFGCVAAVGWFVNSRLLRRPILPTGQLGLYDRLVPAFRLFERLTGPPIGQSLFCVAEGRGPEAARQGPEDA